jgi:hypothetical protein
LYQEYWGLSEKPFENTPDPRFLYKSPAVTETFAKLLYALKSNRGGQNLRAHAAPSPRATARSQPRPMPRLLLLAQRFSTVLFALYK